MSTKELIIQLLDKSNEDIQDVLTMQELIIWM